MAGVSRQRRRLLLQRDRHFPRSVRATLELELGLVRFDIESFKIYKRRLLGYSLA